jgi:hypothetical protein
VDEREILDREVMHHRAAIAQLLASLLDIEENLKLIIDPPEELSQEAATIRVALKGRKAAVDVGSARLKAISRFEPIADD